ncbi:trehalose-6-phosphate synthase [Helicobacter fennelliae]|uniref:trehalose-6-phosphate synthase n=1 Tax=Helicobacter fennelliae TaxID=215 RepID=UPI000DFA6D61|nr:trehalose-6-phosphate synthase [Helicobacter fennelliae]STQ85182.1 translocation protein, low temperature [Helicobacter fennelliae]
MYFIAKTIHILSACVVIGYLVYDVFILSTLKKTRSPQEFRELKLQMLQSSALIMGIGFLLLISSGIYLGSYYLGGDLGFLQNTFQKMLWIKIALVASLFILTPFSLYFVLVLKKPDPFRQHYHHIALVICILAVIVINFALSGNFV